MNPMENMLGGLFESLRPKFEPMLDKLAERLKAREVQLERIEAKIDALLAIVDPVGVHTNNNSEKEKAN